MNITFNDEKGKVLMVDETLNKLLKDNVELYSELDLQEETLKYMHQQIIELQNLVIELQRQQNKNHVTIWGAVKNMLTSKRVTNLSVSEVDLTKE